MRPEDYPYNQNVILEIWNQFRQEHDQNNWVRNDNIDPLIIESWSRCKQHFTESSRLNYRGTKREKTQTLIEQNKDLISIATPYLEDTFELATGVHVVFLTDKLGTILALQLDPTTANIYQRLGFRLGEIWSEEQIGTNAISLSLHTAMVTQVLGAEHYLQIYHEYGNTAAPIHDNRGEIIGTIGLFTPVQQTMASHIALVMATARAITNQIQSNSMLDHANQRLQQLDAIVESVADGVITWDTQWRVDHINSTACKILGIKRSFLLGRTVDTIMDLASDLREAILNHQELSDVETMLQMGERIVKCMISVRAIHDQQENVTGGIATMRPLSQIRNLVNQQTASATRLTFESFAAKSTSLKKVLRQAELAARASAPILLYGESGVGKTTLAQAIHGASPRSKKPLIVVNCSAIPRDMVLSELLGIEAHGGENGRPSKFELADGGTILIDQIDQLSLEGQAVLQDVIDTRHLMRLNSKRATPVNVRVIATTDVDVEAFVEAGGFARQLYFRFSVFKLYLPPLRNRKEDIEILVERFLRRPQEQYQIDEETLELLERYPWPGNVRELESVIERATLHSRDNVVRSMDLPENVRTIRALEPQRTTTSAVLTILEAEREAIVRAGWACQGVISAMADALGINRSTLWRKMNQYGINADDFK